MVQAVTEIPEAEAEGKIKTVYDDIKSTLRTPIVGLAFRTLATHPDYLQVAWLALKPNAQTAFFEARADKLRAFASESLLRSGIPSAPTIPDPARAVVEVFYHLNPKLLLAIAALRSASDGQQPRLAELTRDQKRQVDAGAPVKTSTPSLIDPATASGAVADLFAQIEAAFAARVVPCEYRALAVWPELLREGWDAVHALMVRPEYGQLVRQLRAMVEETVVALPYRMDIGPHVLRQSGLSEQDLDNVHQTLRTYSRLLLDGVVGTAFLYRGHEETEARGVH